MLNIVGIQDEILEHLKANMVELVVEQAIEDAWTVKKVDGKLKPYVAVNFGTPHARATGRTYSGVRTDDYDLIVQVQVIASKPEIARKITYGSMWDALLGFTTKWSGDMRQRPGGMVQAITTSNGATEAYLYASSFSLTFQMSETP